MARDVKGASSGREMLKLEIAELPTGVRGNIILSSSAGVRGNMVLIHLQESERTWL